MSPNRLLTPAAVVATVLGTAFICNGEPATEAAAEARPLGEDHARALEQADRRRLAQRNPEGLRVLDEAEAELSTRGAEASLPLFEAATRAAPESPFPARRYCEVLLELDRAADALGPCEAAVAQRTSGAEVLALTRALLPADAAPLPERVDRAAKLIGRAEYLGRNDARARAAKCYLADRLGDRIMLKDCIEELRGLPAGHALSVTYDLKLERSRFGPVVVLGLLGTLGLSTLAHALWSLAVRLRAQRRMARATAGGTAGHAAVRSQARTARSGALLGLLLVVGLASAGLLAAKNVRAEGAPVPVSELPMPAPLPGQKWTVNNDDPEASVPTQAEANRSPLEFGYYLQELTAKAGWAERGNHHELAVRLYRAVTKAVPDSAVGWAKLCQLHEKQGARDQALEHCRTAATLGGVTSGDLMRLVRLLLHKDGPLADSEAVEARETLQHLKAQGVRSASILTLECDLGIKQGDLSLLEGCVAGLESAFPEDPRTVSFGFTLALERRDFEGARRAILRAQELGLPEPAIARMQAETAFAEAPAWRRAWSRYRKTVALVGLFAVAGCFGWWLRIRSKGVGSKPSKPDRSPAPELSSVA